MDTIHIFEETTTFRLYGRDRANEHFSCSFGLNETFRDHLEAGPLTVAAVDANRNVRIIELSDHSFFVATLFLPQFSSKPGAPHPLILEFVKASAERANGQ